ncbi:peptidase S53 [Sulfolobus sp. A20]|uniref:protease pro-enzyme activation domain-containing protein n=2 Tax=Sulfolobaceae TaxID=118883 RepID=UPI000846067A|nr:protease pro-enzyme activation domain-containing protein [Sulfolobus sp. A20]TRM76302.1 peptidase S53 [Sulfolobus sp. E5]TRM84023.1 peptidase S53 [Sulfolobus sp. A20-N-F6]TRM88568.1 peptidase S53 [Sulfolobus sp. C3]TRN02671.1 peptidase S53 [Sulfolobus sp. F1]AOL15501.1 peptidase S53 [Sulfolobus sp. A20]
MNKGLILMTIMLISITPVFLVSSSSVISYQQPVVLHGFRQVGTLNPNQQVIVSIYLPLKNVGLLYYYASAVSDPNSPLYHKFLTSQEVSQLFLPTNQFNTIMDYLNNDGFKILFTALDSVIVIQGTVSQVEKYLGLNFAVYSNGSVTYYTSYGMPKINALVYSSNVSTIYFSHPSTLITQKDIEKLYSTINQTFPIEGYWPTVLQKVYNTSSIPTQGENTTIGILDFYGDPYIYQQLVYFDKVTGLPNPPNFTVIPIGPYNPNLGILTGWAGEISLDVEVAHTMAPKANIILYIANDELPLASIIAYIVQQDAVNVLSQSFGIRESAFSSSFNGQAFYTCIMLSDEYYALGSAEGITFLASSGDAGGSGYSNGPIGTVGYPATSPFVTSVGGTTVYVQFPNGSYYQTAWSNYGFVPNGLNYGGSTGGVSIIEPKPWYQWSLPTPSTYPNGKLIPEISANANVYPGIFIVCPTNITGISGGTSEASPLTAGILANVESYLHMRIGLLNPILQYMYEKYYGKAIEPVTFGYNIPWVSAYGYNLVTGYGTINAGYFAKLFPVNSSEQGLSIVINVYNTSIPTLPAIQFYPSQRVLIVANVTYNGSPVQSGEFHALVENYLGNLSLVNLTYNPLSKVWVGSLTLPSDANGILFFYVFGEANNGISGIGYYEAFSGYYVEFFSPVTFVPVDSEFGVPLAVNVSNIYGQPVLGPTNITFNIYVYNITNNEYTFLTSINVTVANGTGGVYLPLNLTSGDLLIEAVNGYGFDAFTNGIYMQSLFILPQVVTEPGSVSPGQYIEIEGSITSPINLPLSNPSNVLYGTNITAELLSSNGSIVNKANVLLNPITLQYQGYLYVPYGIPSGLYTILLFAKYYSYSLNVNITGFYYGQIYVSSMAKIKVNSVNYAFEGQNVIVYANITNASGREIEYGMFSATIYPSSLTSQYTTISQLIEIPLWYNPKIGLWEGNFTLPSSLSPGNLSYLAGIGYYGEPFNILVTGVSAFGNPTTTNYTAEYTLYALPYTYIANQKLNDPLTYYASLVNDEISNLRGAMINDFLINDTISNGNLSITSSNISNVVVYNSSLTLSQDDVNNLTLYNSVIYAISSNINGIKLINSKVIPINTPLKSVYPSLPTIYISAPISNLTGIQNITVSVNGIDVSSVNAYLDNQLIASFSSNGTHVITINTTKYPDGSYNLTVIATQVDGLSSSNSTHLYFENSLLNLNSKVNVISSTLNTRISSLNSTLVSYEHTSFTYNIIAIILSVVAIIVGIFALVRRRG